MTNMLNQRSEDINNIATIMQEMNAIAVDIAKEVEDQGEKLELLHGNIQVADKNTKDAVG
jgi:t-SNARE complex subunit (syntaxin)